MRDKNVVVADWVARLNDEFRSEYQQIYLNVGQQRFAGGVGGYVFDVLRRLSAITHLVTPSLT